VGVKYTHHLLSEGTNLESVLALIRSLNSNPTVHGIMIQLPIPMELRQAGDKVIKAIDVRKDVDGLNKDYFVYDSSGQSNIGKF